MQITEDSDNIYLEDYIIPKGETKADGEERRRIVWEMYEVWKSKFSNRSNQEKT